MTACGKLNKGQLWCEEKNRSIKMHRKWKDFRILTSLIRFLNTKKKICNNNIEL